MTQFERLVLRGLTLIISLLYSLLGKEPVSREIDNECFMFVKDATEASKPKTGINGG
jgi:hypothetical protein